MVIGDEIPVLWIYFNTCVVNLNIKCFSCLLDHRDDLSTKIFERFYTDRLSEKNKHSGLGLSIAKKIIESFSGSIKLTNLKSQKYFGACFEINLPLKD